MTARRAARDNPAMLPFAVPDMLFSATFDTVLAPFEYLAAVVETTGVAHVDCA